ncbi:MAG: O-antigen ligase family protein [Acidobacteriota bacterium]
MTDVERFFFYLLGAAVPLSMAATNAALGGLALFFLLRLGRGGVRLPLSGVLLLAFVGWQVVSAILSPHRPEALRGVLDFWSWSAFFFAAALPEEARGEDFGRWSRFLLISMALTLPVSVAAFLFGTDFRMGLFSTRAAVGTTNAHGFFSHHLTYAGVAAIAALVGLAHGVYGKGRRAAWWAGALGGWAALFLSLARTYWLGIVPGALAALWRKGRRFVGVVVLLGAVGAGLLFSVGPPAVRSRLTSIWDRSNPSNVERLCLWKAALDMWRERPVAGWGPAVFEKAAEPFKRPYAHEIHYPTHEGFQTKSHCHSLYLQILVDSGAVGLLLFLLFLLALVRDIQGGGEAVLKAATLGALVAFLAGGLFEFNGGDAEVSTLLFFLAGLAASSPRARASGGL